MINFVSSKRSQISIFVIIAIVIVALIAGYFLLKGGIRIERVSSNLQSVEEYFLSCIEEEAEIGIRILGEKGGYIYVPEFSPGSEYMPFSSQLNFLGSPIPYWYYVSGNNIIREQVPSKRDMELQLEKYLEENLDCNFKDFEARGYVIDLGKVKGDVKILDNSVDIVVSGDLNVNFEDENYRFVRHERKIQNRLGKFYSEALKIYNYEKKEAFLENYAVDVLRMYAPVDGVEMTCSPKIWLKNEVDRDLKEALEANMQAIRFSSLKGKDYFVQDLQVNEEINILYDRNWPTRIEVWDSNNGVMLAEPVGNQPGLGILGFCYVTYHFVYDMVYPVLIQVYDNDELFQFPLAVIIEKNKQREALPVTGILDSEPELCKYPNTEIRVYTYDTSLEPVEADVDFECLGQRCDIGRTKVEGGDASLISLFPQCVNGFISVKAENYANKRYQYSSNLGGEVNIILDKLYDLDLELKVNSKITNDNAIISFISQDNIQSIIWPSQQEVRLSEGQYNISVYVYRDSSITIPGIKKEFCSEVPKSGLLGIFGQTTEKCIDIDIPSQELTNVMSGGGKGSEYLIESQLENEKIIISVNSVPMPTSLEQLQDTYNLLEIKPVYIEFE